MSAYFDLSCDIQRHERRNRSDIAALQEQVAELKATNESQAEIISKLYGALIPALRKIDVLEARHGYGSLIGFREWSDKLS